MARGLVFALCAGLSSAATEFTYSQTQQSATYSIYAASYAFDASEPTPNVAMPSRGAAWLSARLTGSGAGIGDVVVTNRGDAHAAELRKFKVFAGTSAGDTSSADHQCGDAAGVLANGVADGMFTVTAAASQAKTGSQTSSSKLMGGFSAWPMWTCSRVRLRLQLLGLHRRRRSKSALW